MSKSIVSAVQQRPLLTLCVGTLLTILIILWGHIRDLFETARTYSTFQPYLESHPELLYHFHSSASKPIQGEGRGFVPPIIHQIFLTEGRDASLSEYDEAISSCQDLHPNWTHYLWVDENATAFMERYYPEILPDYIGYKQTFQRNNVLRYALLDHFGGVYLDLDITCLQPLDNLRHLPFLTPAEYPTGVNNRVILSQQHHWFLRHVLSGVRSRDLSWGLPYIENILSTGYMFFSNRWMSYVRSPVGRKVKGLEGHEVYILADPEGYIEPHMLRGAVSTPLFQHGGANSWHQWDAPVIMMIGKHYVQFLALFGVGAVFSVITVLKFTRRFGRPRSRSRSNSWRALLNKRMSMEKRDDREYMVGMKEG